MTAQWTPDQLDRFARAAELEISTPRADGTWRRRVPIWVVRVDDEVYVRTWYRRETGWYGAALSTSRVRVRVPGLEADATVELVGGAATVRGAVDAAYRAKYGRRGGTGRMVSDDAASTTLRLGPAVVPDRD